MCSIGSFFSPSLSLLDCNYAIVVVPTSDDFPRISFRSHQHQIISIIGIDLRYLCVLWVLAAISQYGRRNTERGSKAGDRKKIPAAACAAFSFIIAARKQCEATKLCAPNDGQRMQTDETKNKQQIGNCVDGMSQF